MRNETVAIIQDAVRHARTKHPKLGYHWPILNEEIGEIAKAENEGDSEGWPKEVIDSIAVLVRMFEGDE